MRAPTCATVEVSLNGQGNVSIMKGRDVDGTSGAARARGTATKCRRRVAPTKIQLAALRKFLRESPVKPTREGMEAIRRELEGG